jgi:HSP20 family protein
MALVRWSPSSEAVRRRGQMNRFLTDFFHGIDDDRSQGSWSPAVDIFEENGNIELHAELPGLTVKDVELRVENETLTLRGERKHDEEVKERGYHRTERVYGSFVRSFQLPAAVDRSKIKADFKDGLLTVVLPKRDEAKPREITITAA